MSLNEITTKRSKNSLNIRKRLRDDFTFYAEKCLKIRQKVRDVDNSSIKPFEFNRAQKYLHSRLEEQKGRLGKVRALILKGRQQGCSTYVCGRFYHLTTNSFGTKTFILAHEQKATDNLFEIAQRFYDNTPEQVRPSATTNNRKKIIFGNLDSGYSVGTTKNKDVGRSDTIQLFHGSEVGFWIHADEHAKGILQTIPDQPGTEIILESTANGIGNYFHQKWLQASAGLSEYIAVFIPWFWQEEYSKELPPDFCLTEKEDEIKNFYKLTNEQIYWRRTKIVEFTVKGKDGEKSFQQEYPCNPQEAFISQEEDYHIESDVVMRARKSDITLEETHGDLIIGVDPAREGDDRTCIIRRKGRVAYKLETYVKRKSTYITGVLRQIIELEKPYQMCIDGCNLGSAIYDQLLEMGYGDIIKRVPGNMSPMDKDRYLNKRAEMWDGCKRWLEDEPSKIPDDDILHADLCGIKSSHNSNTQLIMESKERMKKRGQVSPDSADALCLTFAFPRSSLAKKNEKERQLMAFANENRRIDSIRNSRYEIEI